MESKQRLGGGDESVHFAQVKSASPMPILLVELLHTTLATLVVNESRKASKPTHLAGLYDAAS